MHGSFVGGHYAYIDLSVYSDVGGTVVVAWSPALETNGRVVLAVSSSNTFVGRS